MQWNAPLPAYFWKILLVGGLWLSIAVNGYATNVDSLKQVVNSMEQCPEKVDKLLRISYLLMRNDPSEAHKYALQARVLSELLDYQPGLADAFSDLGDAQWNQGRYDEAMEHFIQALNIRTALEDSLGMARSLSNIASVHYRFGNYPESMRYHLISLELREKFKDSAAIAHSYLSLGILEEDLHNYKEALDYYDKGLPIVLALGKKRMLQVYYNYIGRGWRKLEVYDKAIAAHEKSRELLETLNDNRGWASYYNNMGSIRRRQGDLEAAKRLFFRATDLHEVINDQEGLADGYNDIGKVYYQLGEYDRALEYCYRALELARRLGLKDDVRYAYATLSSIYGATGAYQQAFEFHQKYGSMKDSLLDKQKAEQLHQLQVIYESEKKAQQIEMLKKDIALESEKKRFVGLAVVAGFVVLILFGGFTYNRYRLESRLMQNILPKETAAELKRYGKAKTRSYQEVTVLFTDFKGFSQIAEKLAPEALVEELDYCFREFDEIISRHGLEKIKTIGDAYMCAGGLPTPNEDHAYAAVKAGLEIQAFMARLKIERSAAKKPFFEARLGIHTGPVVAGIVGVKKFAYDIWGDTVNTASRLESCGEVGKVNVSQPTYYKIKDKFDCTYRGKLAAKNKGEIAMYFVEGERGEVSLEGSL